MSAIASDLTTKDITFVIKNCLGVKHEPTIVIAFLVSDEGGWLTGQTIHATGGMG